MLEKSPWKILDSFNKNWCVKLSISDEIIWFMWLYKFWELYEAWSLCVWDKFRNLWLWTILQKLLFEKFSNLPIFLVTNVDKVQSISKSVWLHEIDISHINQNILSIIEAWWKLLSDDKIYYSKKLYTNDKFYSLNNNHENNN